VVVLDDLGLDVKYYADMNFKEYVKQGAKYIKNNYNDWKTILSHLDLDLDIKFTKQGLKRGLIKEKKLSFDDIEKFFERNCLIMFVINTNIFKGKKGYNGHFVLVTNINKDYIEFHDSGLPPVLYRKENKKKFIQSWYDKDTDRSVLIVFGKK